MSLVDTLAASVTGDPRTAALELIRRLGLETLSDAAYRQRVADILAAVDAVSERGWDDLMASVNAARSDLTGGVR